MNFKANIAFGSSPILMVARRKH